MEKSSVNRIFGLDLLRSLAIVLVVIAHSNHLIAPYTSFPFIALPDGVDLFFVLSGYLVGSILIKLTVNDQNFTSLTVINFLKRRWFRTLPNYFLFLLINIVLIYFGQIKGTLNKYLITYFGFFQNFHKPYDFLFWESWSLSVEEWFYLLFPLILLAVFRSTKIKTKNCILSAIILFLVFPLYYRILHTGEALDIDLYFKKLVLTRLDTIGYGLLGAYLHWYYPLLWHRSRNVLFISGIIILTLLISLDISNQLFLKTFYYSFIGISLLMVLPKLESLKQEMIPLKPFQFLSKISYSAYLVHIPLLQILMNAIPLHGKFDTYILYFTFWISTIAISFFIYKVYEKPMMDLREKL